jgi:16S rRNA (cytosine967-C5)-methyltransferase
VLADENSGQIASFLDSHADAAEEPIAADWGRECLYGRQIFPGEDEMDGFYFACLIKAG